MPGKFTHARGTTWRVAASSLALVAAVAGGTSAAYAQGQPSKAQGKSGNTPAFAKIYQPLAAIVNAPTGDYASIKPQVPAVLAAIGNQDDRFLAGNLILLLGNKTTDRALQRQGLELMVASGKSAPDKLGQMQFLIGNLAYAQKDYAAARAALAASQAAGYQDENLGPVLAETYFSERQFDQGLSTLKTAIAAKRAAGAAVPDAWLRRGLQIAYDNKLRAQTSEWSSLLVSTNPTPANWTTAIQVVNAVNTFDPAVQLDLLRLMATAGAMKDRQDFVRYIEAADPRVMSNEVDRVLQSAVTAGALKPSDTYYGEVKRVVDLRKSADRAESAKLMATARSAANGNEALNAGDVMYSLNQFADAEAMYQLALTKNVADKDRAYTRLGIAQAQQGKTADAKASFAKVGGARAPVAQMWQAYLATKA